MQCTHTRLHGPAGPVEQLWPGDILLENLCDRNLWRAWVSHVAFVLGLGKKPSSPERSAKKHGCALSAAPGWVEQPLPGACGLGVCAREGGVGLSSGICAWEGGVGALVRVWQASSPQETCLNLTIVLKLTSKLTRSFAILLPLVFGDPSGRIQNVVFICKLICD